MEIKITLKDDQVQRLLGSILRRLGDLTPAMKLVGEIAHEAVMTNFEVGGRPKWKPSKRALQQSGQTLVDKGMRGGLMGSINYRALADKVVIGTNKEYAAVHQFGASTGPFKIVPKNKKALFWPGAKHPVKSVNHPGFTIPARPFLSLTQEDWDEIREALGRYLLK